MISDGLVPTNGAHPVHRKMSIHRPDRGKAVRWSPTFGRIVIVEAVQHNLKHLGAATDDNRHRADECLDP